MHTNKDFLKIYKVPLNKDNSIIRPEFFYKLIYGIFFSDLGSGGRKKINKKTLKMTSELNQTNNI